MENSQNTTQLVYQIDKRLEVLATQLAELQRQVAEMRQATREIENEMNRIIASMSPAGKLNSFAVAVSVIAVAITLFLTIALSVRLL